MNNMQLKNMIAIIATIVILNVFVIGVGIASKPDTNSRYEQCTQWINGVYTVAENAHRIRSRSGYYAVRNAYENNELPYGCGDDVLMHHIDLTTQEILRYYDWVLTRNNSDATNILFDADAAVHSLNSMAQQFAVTRK
jgi:hypothetical protein